MTNTNYLKGIRCPKCGSEESFVVTVTTLAEITDDSAVARHGDIEWDDYSYIRCNSCSHDGIVKDFTVPNDCQSREQARSFFPKGNIREAFGISPVNQQEAG